jgi:hypothetical protein
VTIDAAATGEPERSCIMTSQPFLSFLPLSFSPIEEPAHPLPEEESLCPTLQHCPRQRNPQNTKSGKKKKNTIQDDL